MSKEPEPLSVRELLERDEYQIPMYQRNFAWGEGEIRQLIRDVTDSFPSGKPYHMGSLVVHDEELRKDGRVVYSTIDGQQRFTTLTLLACYLKNEKGDELDMSWYERPGISFESREHSTKTIEAAFKGDLKGRDSRAVVGPDLNGSIVQGYSLVKQCAESELMEAWGRGKGVPLGEWVRYLLESVKIMRVKVPGDTDLNHYFEIMNDRGEQLEKHEVLKSRLMEALDDGCPEDERATNRECIHAVWEACSEMKRYVQMGFSVTQRDEIFGAKDWGSLVPSGFDELRGCLGSGRGREDGASKEMSLEEIIEGGECKEPKEVGQDLDSDRFNTVVNYPNFLLHVLRVMTGKDIPLDDKSLLDSFDDHVLRMNDRVKLVKDFIYDLLRCKFLFDQYILKREFLDNKNHWSLQRLKWTPSNSGSGSASYVGTFAASQENEGASNQRIRMLLSAFHVSTPTMSYKYWLNAALNYLYSEKKNEVHARSYLDHLESVARAFLVDRFLGGEDYFVIIHRNNGRCQTTFEQLDEGVFSEKLSFHELKFNFVFNYLDYLLWVGLQEDEVQLRGVKALVKDWSDWEFTFRSSVEHYSPQTPLGEGASLADEVLHSFGNLCLISHSKNSRLSNFTPSSKKEYFANGSYDSLKQALMMNSAEWKEEEIMHHGSDMIGMLMGKRDGDFQAGRFNKA